MKNAAWAIATAAMSRRAARRGIDPVSVMLSDELRVERTEIALETIDAESIDRRCARARAHPGAARFVGEQAQDLIGQRRDVVRRDEDAEIRRANDIAYAADIEADGRHARRHPLDERDRRPLVARRDGDEIARGVYRRDVALPSQHTHAIGEPALRDLRSHGGLELAAASHEKPRAGIRLGDARGGVEKQLRLLYRRQPSDQCHDASVRVEAKGRASLFALARADRGQAREIEAERHDAKSIGRSDRVAIDQIAADRPGA